MLRLPCLPLRPLLTCGLAVAGLVWGRPAFPAPTPAKPTFTFKSLGTLGGATSTAEGVNEYGDVVGVADKSGGEKSPYVYTNSTGMRDLNVITDCPLDSPRQMVFGPDRTGDGIEDMYVACVGNFSGLGSSVVVIDGITGRYVEDFIAPGTGGLSKIAYLYFGPDGDLYIPSGGPGVSGRDRVLRFDGESGAYLGAFVAPGSGGVAGPSGVTFGNDVDGDDVPDFFVAASDSGNVLAYSGVDGHFLGQFVPPGSGGLSGGGDLQFVRDFDGDGVTDLLVMSRQPGAVLIYSGIDGHFIDVFIPPFTTDPLNHMVFGPDGDLYLPVTSPLHRVYRFDGATGAAKGTFVASGAGGLNGPAPFAGFDPAGNLYVNSGNTNQVMQFQGPFGGSPGAFVKVFVTGVGFTFLTAKDINNAGQIVGAGHPFGRRRLFGEISAYVYTPPTSGQDCGSAVDLNLPGTIDEEATAINDAGDVAGHFLASDGKYHAFLWRPGVGATDLGMLSGKNTFATAISARSGGHVQVSGYAETTSGDRAWRYNTNGASMTNLGLISGSTGSSRGWDINDGGAVAGTASAGTKQKAFLRALTGSMTDLGTLGGNQSYGAGINSASSVVGTSDTSTNASQNKHQAFLRTAAHGMFMLEPQITNLPNDMKLKIRPTRISNNNRIVGPGEFDPAGKAFVLTPQ